MTTEKKNEIKKIAAGAGEKIMSALSFLCRNSMVISYDREIFRMPLIIFCAVMLACLPAALAVMLVTLFCGVEYTFTGKDFSSAPKLSFR